VIEVTRDRFLGGRVIADQPKHGFRAGHDTVLLAAAVPAQAGSRVLEMGSGAGIASLCLAARIPGVHITGVDIDPELVDVANANSVLNGMAERVGFLPGAIEAGSIPGAPFDHVFFNPPFHPDTGQVSADKRRDRAKRDPGGAIPRWSKLGLRLVKRGGTVTGIVRADRVDEMLAPVGTAAVTLFPLLPKAGEPPKRCIVRIVSGTRADLVRAAGLILHEADGRNTHAAEAVLRHGAALDLG
jgi:tRNA1(Val) A37 N6-methylase TrmN6